MSTTRSHALTTAKFLLPFTKDHIVNKLFSVLLLCIYVSEVVIVLLFGFIEYLHMFVGSNCWPACFFFCFYIFIICCSFLWGFEITIKESFYFPPLPSSFFVCSLSVSSLSWQSVVVLLLIYLVVRYFFLRFLSFFLIYI